jgi:hypothetical protein
MIIYLTEDESTSIKILRGIPVMDEQNLTPNDSLASLQALLSVVIHRWQVAAIEAQAYRRATQGDQRIAEELAGTLASAPFADRLTRTNALRNQVIRSLADGRPLDISEPLANLGVLLGQTPEGLEESK